MEQISVFWMLSWQFKNQTDFSKFLIFNNIEGKQGTLNAPLSLFHNFYTVTLNYLSNTFSIFNTLKK
jgi:hypothetical protein